MKNRIRSTRKLFGLTQEQLADKTSLTKAHISGLEKGICKNPTLNTIKLLAEALGVSIDWLVYGEYSPKPALEENTARAFLSLSKEEQEQVKRIIHAMLIAKGMNDE